MERKLTPSELILGLCDLVDEVLHEMEAHGSPGRSAVTYGVGGGATVGELVQRARGGDVVAGAYIKALVTGQIRYALLKNSKDNDLDLLPEGQEAQVMDLSDCEGELNPLRLAQGR